MKNSIFFSKILGIIFVIISFFITVPKAFAGPWQGVDANVYSNDGTVWQMEIANDESVFEKGVSIDVKLVVYACREANDLFCDGASADYIEGSRRDLEFPIELSGSSDPDLIMNKAVSMEVSCGRLQGDFVPSDESGNIGGGIFTFSNDCPEPTQALAPTETPTPTPSLTPTPSRTPTPTLRLSITPSPTPNRNLTPTPTGSRNPTSTPTPTPTGILPSPTITQTPTPTPPVTGPTSTPTPPPADVPAGACKCDGIEASGIFPGKQVLVTTFAKVEGNNINVAQVTNMSYSFGVSFPNNPNIVKRLAFSSPVRAQIVERTASKVRYKTTWLFTVPQDVAKTGLVYRVWTEISCGRKVLGASTTENIGILRRAIMFLASIFNKFDLYKSVLGTDDKKSLQLEPVYPAEVTKDFCQSFYFKFKNP